MNVSAPLRTALIGNGPIVALLATWESEPSVHTRRPVPADATYPLAAISPDIAITDRDAIKSRRPVIMRDITIYGLQPDHYRDVEDAAYLVRDLFHRQKDAITVSGYQVIQITAAGPFEAPTDDEKKVGRAVTLTIQLRKVV